MAMLHGPDSFAPWRNASPPTAAKKHWSALVDLLAELAGPNPGELSAQIHRVRETYAPLLERLYEDAGPRLRDLEQLEQLAAQARDRATFLADLALDPPSWTGDLAGPPALDEDYLVLSTIHSAKGLEWDTVFVLHAADGNIPSDLATGSAEEIDEELRLFYVALTRAKQWLYVCCPLRYYPVPRRPTDTHGYAQVTRFLSASVRSQFAGLVVPPAESRGLPGEAHAGEGVTPGPAVTADAIRARQKAGW
jgi:DNA helicase-2/ATP-dependent DNA helicase PcrA